MTEPKPRRFQFSLRTLLLFVAACALGVGVTIFIYENYVVGPAKDSQAGVQLAAMINAYLEDNQCAWPTGWDDLEGYYLVNGLPRVGGMCTFEEVRDCWAVDFRADPVELAQAQPRPGGAPFEVIRQRHRRRVGFPQWEPNSRVLRKLRQLAARQTAAMIVEYLKANNNTWPRSWEDLQKSYPQAVRMKKEGSEAEIGEHYTSFEQARGCMVVDFDARAIELAKAQTTGGRPPFHVVRPRREEPLSDARSQAVRQANLIIYEYLRTRNQTN